MNDKDTHDRELIAALGGLSGGNKEAAADRLGIARLSVVAAAVAVVAVRPATVVVAPVLLGGDGGGCWGGCCGRGGCGGFSGCGGFAGRKGCSS